MTDDLISRQAVLDIDFHKLILTTAKPAEMIRQKIEQLPPVNPQEPKTGHWIDQYNDGNWHCSKCGAIVEKDEQINHNWYFCYHCGAKMVEPQERSNKE